MMANAHAAPVTVTMTTNQYNGKDSKRVQKHTRAASEHESQGPAFPMGSADLWEGIDA